MPNRPRAPDDQAHLDHLYDLIKEFTVAMVVGRGPDQQLWVRPMAIARIDRNGPMYFATSVEPDEVDRWLAEPSVTVVLQGKTRYAAISGDGKVVVDRGLINGMWHDTWKTWFPRGKDDPHLAILVLDPHHGEYWDNSASMGLKGVSNAIKSYMRGRLPTEAEQHAEVDID